MKELKHTVSGSNVTIFRSSIQSSTAEGQYTEPIPVDLLIDILLRVPSKSIARFRCVSKSWANILRLTYFTELFLRKSLNHPRLLFNFEVDGKSYFFSAPQTQNTDSLVATRYNTHSFNHINGIWYSLHGLVYLQYLREDYTTGVMCNPVTGEFITFKMKENLLCPKTYCWYDPTDKKSKVLCVSDKYKFTRAHVLTLETGKHLWRKIDCMLHYPMYSRGICVDGVLYYHAYSAVEYMIVCFNVRSEKFSYIKFKIHDESMDIHACTLINYRGKLGGVQFIGTDKRKLRLWLAEQDHAGNYKWSSTIYELTLSFNNFYIVGMTGASDIVLSPYYLSDPFYVFYYNVERKALTRVEIQGFQEVKRLRPTTKVYTFQDYVEDVKLMDCLRAS